MPANHPGRALSWQAIPVLVRDAAVMTVVFGVAAMLWFGWAQEDPPRPWRLPLGIGGGLGLVAAAIGVFLVWQNWGPETALATASARRAFGITCGIEFGLAGLGAAVLGLTRRAEWIASWIALVVGAHFAPLALIFQDPGLFVLAALMILTVAASVMLQRRRGITPSASTGLGSGSALLAFAVRAALLTI